MELFKPIVPKATLHPNFINTLRPQSAGIRRVLLEWADGFVDRDGKFIKEFQTTYNSAFWELYLFAVLKELGIKIDFSFNTPDFVATEQPIAIEAAIASHAQDDVPEWEKRFEEVMRRDVFESQAEAAIRASNAFLKKSEIYTNRYSQLPYMADRSYVIAIANYGTPDFNLLGDVPMQHLLYDNLNLKYFTKKNGAKIPLGLFKTDQFSHVSAVLYSSVATFGKARALSDDKGEFVFQAVRILNNVEPIRIVATKDNYEESLSDGLRLFTNPHSTHPLNTDLFDDWGIRKIIAEKNGDFVVSCHPAGDLCLRMVQSFVPRGRAIPSKALQQVTFVHDAKTVRVAAGITQKAAAAIAGKLCDNGFSFDKSRIKHIEAKKPISLGEAETYLEMLLSLDQNARTPMITDTLRKMKRSTASPFRRFR